MEKFRIKLIMMTLAPFRNAAVVGLIRRWQLQMLQLHLESLKCCASLIQILIPSHAIQLGQNHRMLWNIGHKVMYVLCVLFAVLFRFSTFPRISIPPCPFRHCELKYLISLRLPHTHSKKTQERRLREISSIHHSLKGKGKGRCWRSGKCEGAGERKTFMWLSLHRMKTHFCPPLTWLLHREMLRFILPQELVGKLKRTNSQGSTFLNYNYQIANNKWNEPLTSCSQRSSLSRWKEWHTFPLMCNNLLHFWI